MSFLFIKTTQSLVFRKVFAPPLLCVMLSFSLSLSLLLSFLPSFLLSFFLPSFRPSFLPSSLPPSFNTNSLSIFVKPSVAENAIESITGSGVVCNIDGIDSNRLLVGNRSLLEEFKIPVSPLVDAAMWDLEIQGKTAVLVTKGETVVGILGIGDVLKADAVSTVQALRSQNIDVWMLTGDNRTTAEAVADQLDISKVWCLCLC